MSCSCTPALPKVVALARYLQDTLGTTTCQRLPHLRLLGGCGYVVCVRCSTRCSWWRRACQDSALASASRCVSVCAMRTCGRGFLAAASTRWLGVCHGAGQVWHARQPNRRDCVRRRHCAPRERRWEPRYERQAPLDTTHVCGFCQLTDSLPCLPIPTGSAVGSMMRNLEIERLTLAAMALGIARRSFEVMNR